MNRVKFNYIFFFAMLLIHDMSFCQTLKEFTVQEEDSLKLESRGNLEKAKIDCIEIAKANAIKKAFGEIMIQGNSTFISNAQIGGKTETLSKFNMIADSWVNGEWVNDTRKPDTVVVIRGNEIWIKAKVYGFIRELPPDKIDFKLITTECPKESCETTTFHEGDNLFIIFKTPVSGYLSIFLDDPYMNTTYMVFPYQSIIDSSQIYIERDREYILFDSHNTNGFKAKDIDELTISLTNKTQSEINKLFVLFSPHQKITKPQLSRGKTFDNNNGIYFPSKLSSEDFQKWILKLRTQFKDLQYTYKYINLNPSDN